VFTLKKFRIFTDFTCMIAMHTSVFHLFVASKPGMLHHAPLVKVAVGP
jgi:hypothetical protein